ncbi:hypothetical protein EJB05_35966, partial [Eragrostis curvula]
MTMIWYNNVPHPKLVEYKKDQKWVTRSDDYLIFPGGGTQFKDGVGRYVQFVEQIMPNIGWGTHTRTVLDVGCGVASFGGYLLDRNVITMSFAPKDEHEAQIYRGKPLLELNRVLRPGGYFVWSATPVYRQEKRDQDDWNAALIDRPLWVMNVVPIGEPDTLPVILNRGLIGAYHDWCESFNTYPRTYDLLHMSNLVGSLTTRCDIIEVAAEIDRILRPGRWFVLKDTMEMIKKMRPVLKSLHYETVIVKRRYLVATRVSGVRADQLRVQDDLDQTFRRDINARDSFDSLNSDSINSLHGSDI